MLNFFDEQTTLYLYQQFKKLFATKEELKKAEAGGAGSGGSGGEGSGLPEVYIGPGEPTGGEALWVDTDEDAPIPEGGLQMVKVWENASPTSEFADQILIINLYAYDAVEIIFKLDNAGPKVQSNRCFIGTNTQIYTIYTGNELVYRSVYVGSGYMQFTDCYSHGNGYLIPYQIYGIKGVRY